VDLVILTLRILEGIAAKGKPWFERATDPPPAFASEHSDPDAPSDASATSSARPDASDQPDRFRIEWSL
jgi:hypothetical protein